MTAVRSDVPAPALPVAPQPTTPQVEDQLLRIPLTQLVESPWNPRKHFDPEKLKNMVESLKNGQLEPIIVRVASRALTGRPLGNREVPRYEIGAGHRRFRAAPAAGLTSLLAIIRDMDDARFFELLNTDNKQRDELDALDEAEGFKHWMQVVGLDVQGIADRIGMSKEYVYARLKLLNLIPAARDLVRQGTITPRHAVLLARLSPTDQKRAMGNVQEIARGSYSRRDSLLLQPDEGAEDQDELPLHDQVKVVSVREFERAIQQNIRATPAQLDPVLFPESAAALALAKEEKLSVILITRDYLASDDVRSAGPERVFGSASWERADGKVEDASDYLGRRRGKVKSKTCEFSRYGFVASGPGQGEVFKVCINKEKCKTHWPQEYAKAQARKKAAKKRTSATSSGSDEKRENAERAAEARREQEQRDRAREEQRWKKAQPAILSALADKLRTIPAGSTSAIADVVLEVVMDGRSKPSTALPRGRTAEDFVRFAALQVYSRDVAELSEDYWRDDAIKNLKAIGIDVKKIVDEVAPKPEAEKKLATKAATKKAKK